MESTKEGSLFGQLEWPILAVAEGDGLVILNSLTGCLLVKEGRAKRDLGPVHTGTQSFRSIFVPVSGTQK